MKILRLKISKSCYSISERLNIKGLLWKHKWFVLGKYGFEELVTFERSGVLHIISGDEEEKASWVYNIKTRALALRNLKVKITRALRPFFWDGCLLVFKLNSVDEYLFLVDVEKAHKLETNPLDSFEAYAADYIQKIATDKRRKKTDEQADLETMFVEEDPKTLLANTPGPVAQNFEPEPEPEQVAPVVVEPPVDVVPLSEVEDRVRQGLEEQKKMLEKELSKKFEEEKDKLSAALWVEKKGVEKRIQDALKQQAWHLEIQTRNRLKEQRKKLMDDEQKSRNRWMQRVKLEVSMLKKKMISDREYIHEKEEAKYKRQLAEEVKRVKKMYESQIRSSQLKLQNLQAELDILNANEESPENLEIKNDRKFARLKQLLDGSLHYRRELEKEVDNLTKALVATQEKCSAAIEAEKKKCQQQLKRAENDAIRQRAHLQHIYEVFESEWHSHQMLSEHEVTRRLKLLWKKDSTHKFYGTWRNISIVIIALAAVFSFIIDPLFYSWQHSTGNPEFSIFGGPWNMDADVLFILAAVSLLTLPIVLLCDFLDGQLLKEKIRRDYDKHFFMRLLGIKESEARNPQPSAAPKTPSHAAPTQSKLGKWFRTLRRRFQSSGNTGA